MNTHELLCKTNRDLIQGKCFSDLQKAEITTILLSSADQENAAGCSRRSARAHDGCIMYPLFFNPPDNSGHKLMTINGVMPRTQILSANHYELEILRLLALWRPGDEAVERMLRKTKDRLSKTCYGNFCSTGECFETSIVALRFLATAFPNEEEWITKLTESIRDEIDNKPRGKKRHSGTTSYYWLTLTDINLPVAISEARRYERLLVHCLSRSFSCNTEYDKLYNPLAKCIARNCLARLPEYHHIKEINGYAGSDGRFHLDLDKQGDLLAC